MTEAVVCLSSNVCAASPAISSPSFEAPNRSEEAGEAEGAVWSKPIPKPFGEGRRPCSSQGGEKETCLFGFSKEELPRTLRLAQSAKGIKWVFSDFLAEQRRNWRSWCRGCSCTALPLSPSSSSASSSPVFCITFSLPSENTHKLCCSEISLEEFVTKFCFEHTVRVKLSLPVAP